MSEPTPEILVLIPARGGSKGVPRKNVRLLAQKPLIAYTIEAALAANVGRVVVSTDDEEIAQAARQAGAEIPFMRPAELATDTASSIDVVLHAVDTLYPDKPQPAICLLQPTSPFRSADDVSGAVERFLESGKPVVGVTAAEKPPQWLLRMDEHGGLQRYLDADDEVSRRQDAEQLFWPNGAIYVLSAEELHRTRQAIPPGALPWPMPARRSLDIDTELDWSIAEALVESLVEPLVDPQKVQLERDRS
jgi:CMP-N-acetylneuraminic acid synthetase